MIRLRLRSRWVRASIFLILTIFISGLGNSLTALSTPLKNKKISNSSRAKSQKKHHRVKHKKHRRIPAAKSLALLRQYLPELTDIDKTNSNENDDVDLSLLGYDFRSPFASSELREKLLTNIGRWLGTRYRFGGSSKRGIDCSGFTSAVISSTIGESFCGAAQTQARKVERVEFDELQFGDLLFFTGRNRKSNRIGHVGIYIGNGVFAHSSTFRGVIYSHITEGYYSERFRFGGRIISARIAGSIKQSTDKL